MPLNPSPSPSSAAKSWCYTLQKEIIFSFLWKIDSFSDLPEKISERFYSSTFSDGEQEKMRWRLGLYPNGWDVSATGFVSAYIQLVSSDTREVQAKFKLSILNDADEEKNAMRYQRLFVPGGEWGYAKFISRGCLFDKEKRLLSEDTLTVYCEISVPDYINISGRKRAGQFRVPESHLSDDFGHVFDSQKLTDVTLCVNGHKFAAHKVILAARSPVFSAMFEHDMAEKKRNSVEIIDMNSETMAALLQYIYTDKFPDAENMADLLFAADKYGLDRLKMMCEEYISSNLSVSNASEVLILADMHSADQLKAHVIDFITIHSVAVMDSPAWQAMQETHPHLVAEASRAVATLQVEPLQKRRRL